MPTPVNDREVAWDEYDEADARFRRKRLGEPAGGSRLGCSLYELPAGERAWPYHYHAGNEEAMYVLVGEGRVRGPDGDVPVESGDYLAFPVGEAGGHRVVNDSGDSLRYLMLSTMREPDVTVYPDSETFGVYAGAPPGSTAERSVEGYFRLDSDVEYWDAGDAADGREDENEE